MRKRLSRQEVLAAIDTERQRQDVKWGGPTHDAGHSPNDWWGFILDHANKGVGIDSIARFTTEMVQIAALAVAAIESIQAIGYEPYCIQLPDDVADVLEEAADDHDLSTEDYIVQCLTKAVEKANARAEEG